MEIMNFTAPWKETKLSQISDTFLNFSYVTPKPILSRLPHPHLQLTNYKVTELERFLLLLALQTTPEKENDTSSKPMRSADDKRID